MTRKYLTYAVVALAVSGALAVASTFLSSLGPTVATNNNLPHIDISNLKPGGFVVADGRLSKIFVLRLSFDELRVFEVPYQKGAYQMPDLVWARAYIPCEEFGPDELHGQLKPEARFRCRRGEVLRHEWWARALQWNLEGRNLAQEVEDLPQLAYEVSGRFLVVGKKK